MPSTAILAADEITRLREEHYNADVVDFIEVHDDLRMLRIHPDWGTTSFLPGQYTVLGLGNWEPRVAEVDEEHLSDRQLGKLLKRAYSFSSPVLDERGHLVPPTFGDYLEFYIVLIRHGEEKPPGLTPRLFALSPGDRLFMGSKVTGHYTLEAVRQTDQLVFVATGTGEAPHNAMIAELLSIGHQEPIVSVVCSRRRRDLGYEQTHRELERLYPNFRYLTLTTREPENADQRLPNFVGKRYLQEFFESGDFERASGLTLNPDRTHVFLCGNPDIIGAPPRGENGASSDPPLKGMVEVLQRRGFIADEKKRPGNIHFEKYW